MQSKAPKEFDLLIHLLSLLLLREHTMSFILCVKTHAILKPFALSIILGFRPKQMIPILKFTVWVSIALNELSTTRKATQVFLSMAVHLSPN